MIPKIKGKDKKVQNIQIPIFCSKCMKKDEARVAMTVRDGFALCPICFYGSHPKMVPVGLVCSKCAEKNRYRIATTIYNNNMLCALCIMKVKPELGTKEEMRRLKIMFQQAEEKQLRNLPGKKKRHKWLSEDNV